MAYDNNLNPVPQAVDSEDQLLLASYPDAIQSPEIAVTRLSQVIAGSVGYSTFNWFYDYVVYTFVLWKFGLVFGGVLIVSLSFALDFSTLKLYDWSRKDWLAIEYLKSLKQYKGTNIIKKLLAFVFNSTPLAVQLIVLSTKFNSFVVTTLLREGAYSYQGLSRRDYFIFIFSNLCGHLYWIALLGLGIEVSERIIS